MPTTDRMTSAEEIAQRKRKVIRTELRTAVGCAIIGAAFLAGTHTMREMSIFLFGWTVGCAFHLTQTVIIKRLGRGKKPRRNSDDAED